MHPLHIGRLVFVGLIMFVFLSANSPLSHTVGWLLFAGVACNSLAVITNSGQMPVVGGTVKEDTGHVRATSRTRLRFLCDRYRLRKRGWTPIFSVGDVLIVLALVLNLIKF